MLLLKTYVMRKKSADLIPLIVKASDEASAIDVLHKTLEYLHLSSTYTTLVGLRDRMVEFQKQYEEIVGKYKSLPFPRDYKDLAEIRDSLAFLYRDIQDELSFEVNKAKSHGDEAKTLVRAEAVISAKENEKLKEVNGGKPLSMSALDRLYGISDEYQEYLNTYGISYGLYQALMTLLTSIRIMSDSIASQASYALTVLQRDVR